MRRACEDVAAGDGVVPRVRAGASVPARGTRRRARCKRRDPQFQRGDPDRPQRLSPCATHRGAIGKAQKPDQRAGCQCATLESLGPTRLQNGNLPDRERPFGRRRCRRPGFGELRSQQIVDRRGSIAGLDADIHQGLAKVLILAGHLDGKGDSVPPSFPRGWALDEPGDSTRQDVGRGALGYHLVNQPQDTLSFFISARRGSHIARQQA